ncbi:sensor domain-containing diguanylate cyclase [Erythrobacter sp.]|uniref:sensor domain-containing diguanylate cyclase n=1 Tax=Erythrobacter sp. TaxID=1042 RepID=UPI001B1DB16D|nr:sensor domain-containing diguanylate cyclase [Erythrobacter sp.]MBO6526806.1 diguanylate cyclase [Erythrobacter sp.]MBO6528479.1 diguanylate cyclase [Erythrobacter sp.]
MTFPIGRIAVYAAIFFAVTSLTIFWTRFAGGLALVWPGTAIAAALFLSIPRSKHFGAAAVLIVLSTLATSLFGFGPEWAFPLALINIFEAWLIAWLLVRFRPQRDYIESEGGVVSLGLLAGIVGPSAAAIPGGILVTRIVGGGWHDHAFSWLVGHGLGTLLVLPLALLLASYKKSDFARVREPGRVLPFIAMILLTLGISAIAFLQSTVPSLFLPIVPLVVASFRLERFGASIAVLIISVAAAGSLGMGVGVFAELGIPLWQKALFLQFYLSILLLMAFPLAVALKQRQRLMEALADREAMQRLIADHSDDALLHLDREGMIRFASPASNRLSGRDAVEGLHLAAFFSDFDRAIVDGTLDSAARYPGHTEIMERSVERRGQTRWLEAKLRAIEPSKQQASTFVVTIRDVTERKLEELQASWEARTDSLTGLPNRRALLDILEAQLEFADEQPFAFALVDLDHFKRVNDSYGHAVGDLVLKQIAQLMRENATDDCFFARLGGEEFGMIAVGPAMEHASIICERLRLAIQRHVMTDNDGGTFNVTASIGIARIAERCSSSMAMQAADGPLYSAKAAGRNCLRYAQDMGRYGGISSGDEKSPPFAVAN